MEAQPVTRRDLETALIEKCWKDREFRKAVVSDPKAMITPSSLFGMDFRMA